MTVCLMWIMRAFPLRNAMASHFSHLMKRWEKWWECLMAPCCVFKMSKCQGKRVGTVHNSYVCTSGFLRVYVCKPQANFQNILTCNDVHDGGLFPYDHHTWISWQVNDCKVSKNFQGIPHFWHKWLVCALNVSCAGIELGFGPSNLLLQEKTRLVEETGEKGDEDWFQLGNFSWSVCGSLQPNCNECAHNQGMSSDPMLHSLSPDGKLSWLRVIFQLYDFDF